MTAQDYFGIQSRIISNRCLWLDQNNEPINKARELQTSWRYDGFFCPFSNEDKKEDLEEEKKQALFLAKWSSDSANAKFWSWTATDTAGIWKGREVWIPQEVKSTKKVFKRSQPTEEKQRQMKSWQSCFLLSPESRPAFLCRRKTLLKWSFSPPFFLPDRAKRWNVSLSSHSVL